MFGFHFLQNFDLPYISKNITEFWRRWHISLSNWFRDYVYIPLGGNKKRVYINLAIIFLLTGIWHGAAWNYIFWGIWNGTFVIIERYVRNHRPKDIQQKKAVYCLSRIYTLLVINLGWVLFRAPSINKALCYFAGMFGVYRSKNVINTVAFCCDRWTLTIMIVGILFSSSVPQKIIIFCKKKLSKDVYDIFKYAVLLMIFGFSVIRVVAGSYNPFIYFQF